MWRTHPSYGTSVFCTNISMLLKTVSWTLSFFHTSHPNMLVLAHRSRMYHVTISIWLLIHKYLLPNVRWHCKKRIMIYYWYDNKKSFQLFTFSIILWYCDREYVYAVSILYSYYRIIVYLPGQNKSMVCSQISQNMYLYLIVLATTLKRMVN